MGRVRECDGRSGSEPVVSIIAAGMGVPGDCGVAGAQRIGPSRAAQLSTSVDILVMCPVPVSYPLLSGLVHGFSTPSGDPEAGGVFRS